jgi:hypothetical protein
MMQHGAQDDVEVASWKGRRSTAPIWKSTSTPALLAFLFARPGHLRGGIEPGGLAERADAILCAMARVPAREIQRQASIDALDTVRPELKRSSAAPRIATGAS